MVRTTMHTRLIYWCFGNSTTLKRIKPNIYITAIDAQERYLQRQRCVSERRQLQIMFDSYLLILFHWFLEDMSVIFYREQLDASLTTNIAFHLTCSKTRDLSQFTDVRFLCFNSISDEQLGTLSIRRVGTVYIINTIKLN